MLFVYFDAKKYVQAVLDENFKGDVSAAAIMIKDQTAEELQEHYETGIENFLDKNVLSGVKVDDATREKYKLLCKDIFSYVYPPYCNRRILINKIVSLFQSGVKDMLQLKIQTEPAAYKQLCRFRYSAGCCASRYEDRQLRHSR